MYFKTKRSEAFNASSTTPLLLETFQCYNCKENFLDLGSLNEHVKNKHPSKNYECKECKKYYASAHVLSRHMLIHTGEKPYKCNYCDKSFNQASSLKKHILTHTRVKTSNKQIYH